MTKYYVLSDGTHYAIHFYKINEEGVFYYTPRNPFYGWQRSTSNNEIELIWTGYLGYHI